MRQPLRGEFLRFAFQVVPDLRHETDGGDDRMGLDQGLFRVSLFRTSLGQVLTVGPGQIGGDQAAGTLIGILDDGIVRGLDEIVEGHFPVSTAALTVFPSTVRTDWRAFWMASA